MAGLNPAQAALRAVLGAASFIRRDRLCRALFVSDYPARLGEAEQAKAERELSQMGWQVERQGKLALLDWDVAGYTRFMAGLQPLAEEQLSPAIAGLAHIVMRHPTHITPDLLAGARAAVLAWDAGDEAMLLTLSGEQTALALRQKQPLPAHLLPLLMSFSARP